MPGIKKILFLLLALSLVFTIVSCSDKTKVCASCIDSDSDDICDVCKKEMPAEDIADVPLFEDGEPSFQIVLAKNTSSAVKQAINSTLNAKIEDCYGVTINSFTEESDNDKEIDVEILIGNVTARGEECFFDGHSLGKEGYVIKIIGSKIILNAGSDEALIALIEDFTEFLVDRDSFDEVVLTKEDTVLEIQDDYRITALKVAGNDMRGYTLAADLTRKNYKDVALDVQDAIYETTGYWFKLVDVENATDKSMIITHVDGVSGAESFRVSAKGSQLVIECGYDNCLESSVFQFVTQKISTARGDVNFSGTVYTQDISVVYYDDFGAKGDGVTDDFLSIYNAHVFANESGQTVKASRNPKEKVYYIHDTRTNPENNNSIVRIPIRTTTDWQDVRIVIDDEKIATFENKEDPDHQFHYKMGRYNIFEILPDEEHEIFTLSDVKVTEAIVADGLNPDTKKINLKIDGWDGGLMIVPYNSEHGVFRRRGSHSTFQSDGDDMHEIIVIDKDGNVDPETPIMFEYTNVDYFEVYKLDPESAITVSNATIETISSRVQNKRFDKNGNNLFSTAYIRRGIHVSRSYTVIENIKHEVSGGFTLKERANGFESCNYEGSFYAFGANHVTFRNCEMKGRQQYDGHSSYDFGAKMVNKIVLENCIQTNFWVTVDSQEGIMHEHVEYVDGAYPSMSTVQVYDDQGVLQKVPMCWGIGGTNYCKNMEYINSQLSRFDAHAGLYNGKIINSKVNYLALTGYGDMIIENSIWYQADHFTAMLALRSDYGNQWDGDIILKDTKAYIYDIGEKTPVFTIVGHTYDNFYCGYTVVFPNVTVDNLDIYSTKTQAPVASGYALQLLQFNKNAKKMHLLDDSDKKAIFTCVDNDGDGYVDEPVFDSNLDGRIDDADKIDFDGDGKVGNTSIKYSDYKDLPVSQRNKGAIHPTCERNLNPVKPPAYFKVINNDGVDGTGGYVFNITDTSGDMISDGGWYRDEITYDTMGGFFGATKFIYGEGENDYVIGTSSENTVGNTFVFIKHYYD